MMILEISKAVVGLSVSSSGTVRGCTEAAGALRVASRMSSTFFPKCAANSSAVHFRVVDVNGILSSPLTFDQSAFESPILSVIALVQNAQYLSCMYYRMYLDWFRHARRAAGVLCAP